MKKGQNIKLWAVAVWLIIWELAARLLNKEIFLVSPVKAIMRFIELATTGRFWISVAGSFLRISVGFLLAVVAGILLAILSAKYKRIRELLAPVMLAIKAVPIASFIILALICFSSKYLAVLISFMIVLPTIYENVFTGIAETDKSLLEMGKVFGLSPVKIVRYIYAAEVHPYFCAACKTAAGMAWKAGIAAEVIGTPKGSIGAMLHQAKIYLETADLLAWTIGVVLLSLLMEKVFLWIVERAAKKLRCIKPAKDEYRGAYMQRISADGVSSTLVAPSITLANISKSFAGQQVLDTINFVFPSGKISAVMGKSGAGKTTLMRIITELETPDAGSVDLLEPQLAVMFQEDRLIEYMTAEENIRLVNENLTSDEVKAAMRDIGFTDDEVYQPVSEFSGGMKRRVALLRALLETGKEAGRPEVILLDEPFKGLDEKTKKDTMDFVKNKIAGITTILITHDKTEADALGVQDILYV